MGVKLAELIPSRSIEISELNGKAIAIDFSNVVFQFLASIRQPDGSPLMDSKGRVTSHLMGIFTRSSNLLQQGIKLCYVFDGKPPALKYRTIAEREERKLEAEKKFTKAKEKKDIVEMARYAKQTTRVNKEIFEESRELIKAMGMPVIQAPSEAEAQAAFMCKQKDVYAVGSQDTDSLLFGSPRLIQNLTLSQKRKLPSGGFVYTKPFLIELKEVLNNLKINRDQLIAIAMLVGTDFNPGGVRGIGPKTALKLVKQYKNFDKIFKEVKADFNWKEVYAVFKNIPVIENYQLKWNELDVYKVKKLLVDEHDFSEERVDNILARLKKRPVRQEGLKKWF